MHLFTTIAAASVAAVATLAATPAAAQVPTPQAGVVCRAGTQPEFENNVLRCRSERRVELPSICSPVAFAGNGDIQLNTRVLKLEATGSDVCVGPNGARAASVMRPPVPGVDPAPTPGTYRRVVDANGPDVFVAEQVQYEFPQGLPFIGDAGRGVTCKHGFNEEQFAGGRGLRCVKQEVQTATCDGGFEIERRSGADRCVKRERDVFGNMQTTIGQYTIPAGVGYIGLMGNPAQHGWRLDTDRARNVDSWVKADRHYAFAEVR